jgi:aspartyl-tRNA(Asn)/glutamyl-tRNA(Gln) amidotransferase subunit C
MMTISRDEVLQIARLARIELRDDEVETYQRDLNSILDYIDKLRDLDAPEARTTHAVALESRMREDVVERQLALADVLRNAPDSEDGQFRVPKVVED